MVLILNISYKLTKKVGITECLKRIYKTLKRCITHTCQAEVDVGIEHEFDTGSLPDRLINPGKYEPVLSTTEEHTAAEQTGNKEPRRLTPVYTYGSIN